MRDTVKSNGCVCVCEKEREREKEGVSNDYSTSIKFLALFTVVSLVENSE